MVNATSHWETKLVLMLVIRQEIIRKRLKLWTSNMHLVLHQNTYQTHNMNKTKSYQKKKNPLRINLKEDPLSRSGWEATAEVGAGLRLDRRVDNRLLATEEVCLDQVVLPDILVIEPFPTDQAAVMTREVKPAEVVPRPSQVLLTVWKTTSESQ